MYTPNSALRSRTPKKALTGAAFLMATSAIGPGFLTQTSVFTGQLLASFGFAILIVFILDVCIQLNIWRIISLRNKRAQELADELMPGLGLFLAILIGFGGLAFNTGNLAGCALGLDALAGLPLSLGCILSILISLGIFWYHEAGLLMDNLVKVLGILMIIFTLFIAISSKPPYAEAAYRTFIPEHINVLTIITLVGGTVGGYISFAGAHRLIDAGIHGPQNIRSVTRSAVTGIALTSLMRFVLFLAALGVSVKGIDLNVSNPSGKVFSAAGGKLGLHFFGFVMWCAAITSVIGASYTTVSFFASVHPVFVRYRREIISTFIISSGLIFLLVGSPVSLLLAAGAVNGLILPISLAVLLIVANRFKGPYAHPLWLKILGWLAVIVMTVLGYLSVTDNFKKLFH